MQSHGQLAAVVLLLLLVLLMARALHGTAGTAVDYVTEQWVPVGDVPMVSCNVTQHNYKGTIGIILLFLNNSTTVLHAVDARKSGLAAAAAVAEGNGGGPNAIKLYLPTFLRYGGGSGGSGGGDGGANSYDGGGRDGGGERDNKRYQSDSVGFLLPPVSHGGGGRYHCRVDYRTHPTTNTYTFIHVLEGPGSVEVFSSLEGLVVETTSYYTVGDNLTLTCIPSGGVPPPTVYWTEGLTTLSGGSGSSGGSIGSSDSDGSGGSGSSSSGSSGSSGGSGPSGDGNGGSGSSSSAGNGDMDAQTDGGNGDGNGGKLHLGPLKKWWHGRRLTCHGSNLAVERGLAAPASAAITLRLAQPPQRVVLLVEQRAVAVLIPPSGAFLVRAGSPATLLCLTMAIPPPRVAWYLGGRKLGDQDLRYRVERTRAKKKHEGYGGQNITTLVMNLLRPLVDNESSSEQKEAYAESKISMSRLHLLRPLAVDHGTVLSCRTSRPLHAVVGRSSEGKNGGTEWEQGASTTLHVHDLPKVLIRAMGTLGVGRGPRAGLPQWGLVQRVGDSFTITCTILGQPPAYTIHWYYNGNKITPEGVAKKRTERTTSAEILDSRNTDDNLSTKGHSRSKIQHAQLYNQYNKDQQTDLDLNKQYHKQQGERQLYNKHNNNEQAQYYDTDDSDEVLTSDKVANDDYYDIVLPTVTKTTNKETISSSLYNEYQSDAYDNSMYMVPKATFAHVTRPSKAMMTARMNSTGEKFLWEQQISNIKITQTITGSQLRIVSVAEKHEGIYECRATNELGTAVSSPVYLEVESPPQCQHDLGRVVTVTELPHRLTLHCGVSSRPDPSSYTWTVNGKSVITRKDSTLQLLVTSGDNLTGETSELLPNSYRDFPEQVMPSLTSGDLKYSVLVVANSSWDSSKLELISPLGADLGGSGHVIESSLKEAPLQLVVPLSTTVLGQVTCAATNTVGDNNAAPCRLMLLARGRPQPVRDCSFRGAGSRRGMAVYVVCSPGWDGGYPPSYTLSVRTLRHTHGGTHEASHDDTYGASDRESDGIPDGGTLKPNGAVHGRINRMVVTRHFSQHNSNGVHTEYSNTTHNYNKHHNDIKHDNAKHHQHNNKHKHWKHHSEYKQHNNTKPQGKHHSKHHSEYKQHNNTKPKSKHHSKNKEDRGDVNIKSAIVNNSSKIQFYINGLQRGHIYNIQIYAENVVGRSDIVEYQYELNTEYPLNLIKEDEAEKIQFIILEIHLIVGTTVCIMLLIIIVATLLIIRKCTRKTTYKSIPRLSGVRPPQAGHLADTTRPNSYVHFRNEIDKDALLADGSPSPIASTADPVPQPQPQPTLRRENQNNMNQEFLNKLNVCANERSTLRRFETSSPTTASPWVLSTPIYSNYPPYPNSTPNNIRRLSNNYDNTFKITLEQAQDQHDENQKPYIFLAQEDHDKTNTLLNGQITAPANDFPKKCGNNEPKLNFLTSKHVMNAPKKSIRYSLNTFRAIQRNNPHTIGCGPNCGHTHECNTLLSGPEFKERLSYAIPYDLNDDIPLNVEFEIKETKHQLIDVSNNNQYEIKIENTGVYLISHNSSEGNSEHSEDNVKSFSNYDVPYVDVDDKRSVSGIGDCPQHEEIEEVTSFCDGDISKENKDSSQVCSNIQKNNKVDGDKLQIAFDDSTNAKEKMNRKEKNEVCILQSSHEQLGCTSDRDLLVDFFQDCYVSNETEL